MLVAASPQLQAAVEALNAADGSLRLEMQAVARQRVAGQWIPALQARAARPLDREIILAGAAVEVSDTGFTVLAAQSEVPLSNGLIPAWDWPGEEFGAHRRRAVVNAVSKSTGKPYRVSKILNRQFPGRQKAGRVAFDAASDIGTKLVGAYVSGIYSVYRRHLAPFGGEER